MIAREIKSSCARPKDFEEVSSTERTKATRLRVIQIRHESPLKATIIYLLHEPEIFMQNTMKIHVTLTSHKVLQIF